MHRVTLAWLAPRARDVDATEVHLDAPLADRELNCPPAQEMERAGMRLSRASRVAGVDRREATAVPVQDESRDRVTSGIRVARLEVDQVPGSERPHPPAGEIGART